MDQICQQHPSAMELMHNIIQKAPLAVIKAYLTHSSVNHVHDKWGTPLLQAIKNNDHHIVMLLLEYGANVNYMDPMGRNMLHIAIENEYDQHLALALLRQRPITNTVSSLNDSYPLSITVERNDLYMTEQLWIHGADPNFLHNDWTNGPPMLHAVLHGHVSMIELLIFYGANLNYKDRHNHGYLEQVLFRVFDTPDLEPPVFTEVVVEVLVDSNIPLNNLNLFEVLEFHSTHVHENVLRAYGKNNSFGEVLSLTFTGDKFTNNDNIKVLLRYLVINVFHATTTICREKGFYMSKELYKYYMACVHEVQKMSMTYIANKNLHLILTDAVTDIEPSHVSAFLNSHNTVVDYPIHFSTIQYKLKKLLLQLSMKDSVIKNLYKITGTHSYPIGLMICKYLCGTDLEKLQLVLK